MLVLSSELSGDSPRDDLVRVLSSELSGAVSTTAHALAVSVSPGDTRLEAREEKNSLAL